MAGGNLNIERDERGSEQKGLVEGSKHIIRDVLTYANPNRCGPASLTALFLTMYVIKGSGVALRCTGIMSLVLSALYMGAYLLVKEDKWSWLSTSRAQIWSESKHYVICKMNWCKQNKSKMCFYIGILLYSTALFAADGSRYIHMVTYIAPCLTALPTVTQFDEQIRNVLERLEHLTGELGAIAASVGRVNEDDVAVQEA